MKLNVNIALAAILIIFFSCKENDFTDEKPRIPDSLEVDVNGDEIIDYVLEYYEVEILSPDSDFGIIGIFNPLNENEILLKKQTPNLFLRDLQEVKDSVAEPLFWNNIGFQENIISISNNSVQQWPKEWEVNSSEIQETYFLGLKIIEGSLSQLGWVELAIDISNGEVEVIEKGIF